jgi:hypothetical protein
VFVFFDGTWNHDEAWYFPSGVGYTNIVRMRNTYKNANIGDYIYRRGIGNVKDRMLVTEGIIAGISGWGMLTIARTTLEQFLSNYRNNNDIFVSGFSRGAATALVFSQLLDKEAPDLRIKGMYLYDTVSSTGIPGNGKNWGVPAKPGANVSRIVHAIAFQEDRTSFPVSNIHARGSRITQKAFWGTHGNVGGGYANNMKHEIHTLWWMSNKIIERLPAFPQNARPCHTCDRYSSNYPHSPITYALHGGKSFGELFRPTTEEPMMGVLALAYFFDDIDFTEVRVDSIDAQTVALAYIPLYLILTETFAAAFTTYNVAVFPWLYQAWTGMASAYRLYHYTSLYSSIIQHSINRI